MWFYIVLLKHHTSKVFDGSVTVLDVNVILCVKGPHLAAQDDFKGNLSKQVIYSLIEKV